jgi:glycosyltransferase involved in cell wall biosynthesis
LSLNNKNISFRLNIVGNGSERAQFEALALKYNLLNKVIFFHGFQLPHSVAKLMGQAHCFLLNSNYEGLPCVLLEAMACGTPVASYPVQGPLDVVEQGVTGFMNEDLTDAITGCLQLDRDRVLEGSQRWSWDNAWKIFRDNLTPL